jgi:hypothetical protein
MDRGEYWEWAEGQPLSTIFGYYRAGIEFAKDHEVPAGTIGYDRENNVLFVSKERWPN